LFLPTKLRSAWIDEVSATALSTNFKSQILGTYIPALLLPTSNIRGV